MDVAYRVMFHGVSSPTNFGDNAAVGYVLAPKIILLLQFNSRFLDR